MEDINRMTEDEIVKLFESVMKQYVDEFHNEISGISARCHMHRDSFYIDYGTIRPTYTKDMAKRALQIFRKYENILSLYVDILKFKYKDIEYFTGKTELSSARIGKEFYVSNFPFKLPNLYYDENGLQ